MVFFFAFPKRLNFTQISLVMFSQLRLFFQKGAYSFVERRFITSAQVAIAQALPPAFASEGRKRLVYKIPARLLPATASPLSMAASRAAVTISPPAPPVDVAVPSPAAVGSLDVFISPPLLSLFPSQRRFGVVGSSMRLSFSFCSHFVFVFSFSSRHRHLARRRQPRRGRRG